MIFFQRRRLILWLIRAYIRKWRKTIILFFFLGLSAFFLLYLTFSLIQPSVLRDKDVVGIIGSYTLENLPAEVLSKMSYGLSGVSENGRPYPMAASSWTISDNGRTYKFILKDNLKFNNGKNLISHSVEYNFQNVAVERPSKDTIIFKLKDSYSPFLLSVSRPIFLKNFVGLKDYKIKEITRNGDFLDSMTLISTQKNKSLVYQFYPTEESLKIALLLGEINKTDEISNLSFLEENLSKFKNLKVKKTTNFGKLVTIFYNTLDKNLSDKKLREALNFALPDTFSQGKRNYTPYPPALWASSESLANDQDLEHARALLEDSSSSASAKLSFNMKALSKYKDTALEVKNAWQKLGIKVDIETVNAMPSTFDMFLGEFTVSKDPDQYVLWHSSQENNITKYKNLRIDKLLEDGRQITDTSQRRKIYADFQKYLLDDPPASFLFFPYNYSVSK